jgi:phosphatidylglycerol lysyltransferase
MTATLDHPGRIRDENPSAAPRRLDSTGPRRLLALPGLVWHAFRSAPAALCFLVAVWAVGLGTHSTSNGPSPSLSGHVSAGLPSLAHGYWWTPLSSGLWAAGLFGYLAVTVLGLLILAPAEHRLGTPRMLATLLFSQGIAYLLAGGLIKLGGLVHQPWLSQLTGETALGALPGVAGVGFALSRALAPLWRRRLRLLLALAATIGVMYIGHLGQVALACGVAAGGAAALLASDRARSQKGQRASQHEVRMLIAMLAAAPALGALLATLSATANGPVPLSAIYSAGMHAQAAPALLLLLCAYGLRRGRRLAWWLAVVTNLIMLAVSIWGTRTPVWTGMLLPVVTLIVLLATRRRFDQSAGRRAVRRLAAVLGAALSASFGTFVTLEYLQRWRSGPRPGYGVPARALPTRFLTYMLFGHRSLPAGIAGRLLYLSIFLVFWTVVFGALTASFLHTCGHRDTDAADRARAVLTRGGSTLSYMSTWRGNRYWISPDGRAAIAYRAIAGVAVTVGEPYGDPAARDAAIGDFARFCEHHSLQPCLYSVTAQTRAVTDQLGWKSVQIAEDAILPLASLTFAGKKWQTVRAAMNKAARENITAEWVSYPEAPPDLVRQIRQISGKWLADKGLPEMGFTLGGLDELNDPKVRCLIAVGADRKVHAFTSWLPVYENGRPVAWTLDLMRRNTDPGTVRGVMEFLIATAAKTFQDEGARFVSLAAAPLARLDRSEQPCTVRRLLDMTANAMEPVYGFQSLLQFKDKFHPVYQPLYLAYPDPAALGSIATAISRAYLPRLTSRQALRLLTKLHWPPAKIATLVSARRG